MNKIMIFLLWVIFVGLLGLLFGFNWIVGVMLILGFLILAEWPGF